MKNILQNLKNWFDNEHYTLRWHNGLFLISIQIKLNKRDIQKVCRMMDNSLFAIIEEKENNYKSLFLSSDLSIIKNQVRKNKYNLRVPKPNIKIHIGQGEKVFCLNERKIVLKKILETTGNILEVYRAIVDVEKVV